MCKDKRLLRCATMAEAALEEMLTTTGLTFLSDPGLDIMVLTGPPEAYHQNLDALKDYIQPLHEDADDASSQRLAELIIDYRLAHPVDAPAARAAKRRKVVEATEAPTPQVAGLPSNLLELLRIARSAAAPAEGPDVLVFIGETGVSKTTCIRHFLDHKTSTYGATSGARREDCHRLLPMDRARSLPSGMPRRARGRLPRSTSRAPPRVACRCCCSKQRARLRAAQRQVGATGVR